MARALVFLLLVVDAGRAMAATPAAVAEAETLIARGLELRREGKPEEALGFFERAHAVAPSPRTLGQMGLVETALQRWVEAEQHLLSSLSSVDDGWVKKNRELLEKALAVTKEHIGELMVTGPAGTEVAVDGRPAGKLPEVRPLRVAAGTLRVTANGSGFKEFSKSVTVQPGARTSLAIVLDPIEARSAVALSRPVPIAAAGSAPSPHPALAMEPQPPAAGSGWRTWTGVGLVSAGAGLLAWGALWIAIDGQDVCGTTTARGCVYDTETTGWIIAGAGAVAAIAGTSLLLMGRSSRDRNVALDFAPGAFFLRGRF
jgi:hypothetical protein